MATINLIIAGGPLNAVLSTTVDKIQCVTSTNTWSLITNFTAGVGEIYAVGASQNSCYYVAHNSTIWKYDKNFALDTSWGTNGTVVITALLAPYEGYNEPLAINNSEYLCAVRRSAAGSAINCWVFNSAGTSSWARSTITTLNSPVSVGALPNGNFIMGGAAGSVVGLREYSYTDGSYLKNYAAISMTQHVGLCINSVGDIFTGGTQYNSDVGIVYKFLTSNSVPSWSFVTGFDFRPAAMNSAFVFTIATPSTTYGDAHAKVINKATGIITASATISMGASYGFEDFVTLTTVPNVWIVASLAGNPPPYLHLWILDETATILAKNTATGSLLTTDPNSVIGTFHIGFNVQTPRALTYQRKLLAFACNQIWAEVTA